MFDLYFQRTERSSSPCSKYFARRLQMKSFSELLDQPHLPSLFSDVAVGLDPASALARRAIDADGTELHSEKQLFCFDIESALNPVYGRDPDSLSATVESTVPKHK
jgi:hypothetical protein